MVEAIQNLVQLQQLDFKLDQIERDKGDLPARVDELKQSVDKTKDDLEQVKSKIAALEIEKRRIEGEINVLEEKKKHNEERLYSVTTNKEYDAVTLEIEAVIKDIDENETKLLEAIEDIENSESLRDDLEKELAEVQKTYALQSADLHKKIALNADKESELNAERVNLTQAIPIQHLRLYERIRPSKDGLALVGIVRGACGGCYTQIPPQRVMEIRDQDKLIECESCGRIFYWQEENEEVPAT